MTATQSGYDYQLRYAVWRAVWIAAGRDPLSDRAATVRVEYPVQQQSVDVVVEDAGGEPLELVETKEHDSFLPLKSVKSFLVRAEAIRPALPKTTRFRFVCNQKLTDGLDLGRRDHMKRALASIGVARLDGRHVLWELGAPGKSALVDRTMVLLAAEGGDARDVYFRFYARAHAQLAIRRPKHAKVLQEHMDDLLAELYTSGERHDVPRLAGEPGLDIGEIRETMARLARERPPVRKVARKHVDDALRRKVFRDDRISIAEIFVEPSASLLSTHQRTMASASAATPLLLRWLTNLREGREPRQPLLLLGTFGVGKSTLLTMFAHTLLDEGMTPVLVPLRDLAGVEEGFRKELDAYAGEAYGVKLPDPAGDVLQYVFLCDGFDELNLYYSRLDSGDWARRAYDALTALARRSDVAVVVSSRPLVSLERQPSQPVLELDFFSREQIEQWCANYRSVRPHVDDGFQYETLWKRGLAEEAQTPIVLYMIAILYEDGLLTREHYTRMEIFRTFIDWTVEGGYGSVRKHRVPKNYREILQDIAWLLFLSDHGYLPESLLVAALREKHGKVRDQIDIGSNLLVAHMLQPARGAKGTDRLIEFTHQSFREYLVAERLWRLLEPVRRGEPVVPVWEELGESLFTNAEVAFLDEMVAAAPAEEALHLYDGLRRVEMPAAYFAGRLWQPSSPGRAADQSIAARAVLAFLLRVKLYRRLETLGVQKEVSPPFDRTFRSLLDFVSALGAEPPAVQKLLLQNLAGLRLPPEAELSNIELPDAELQDVHLVKASLKRAILVGCNIERSRFVECDFSHASIAAQYLFRTKFDRCDFTAAEIHVENPIEFGTTWHNDFSGSNFTDAVFTGLQLRFNRFTGNDWTRTRVEAEDEVLLERCTLDRNAQRFFRGAGVKLVHCKVVEHPTV